MVSVAVSMHLTVLICTHNRVELLRRTLDFLCQARHPRGCRVDVLVMANACTDDTHAYLQRLSEAKSALPLRWEAEALPGKSHALNRAMPLLSSDLVAFVDDDHRVDPAYLENVCRRFDDSPDVDILCGRILPDWDGSEPAWVHDQGPYRIYPLPVPRYDLGEFPLASPQEKAIPGGGNLILRTSLFDRVGGFSTEYGPVGHNLAGGEDQEWVKRAIAAGARLHYVPDVVQYHYVDPNRLQLRYLLQKAYERSASVVRLSAETVNFGVVPRYMVRKVAQYALSAMMSLNLQRRRFHLVRAAAAIGEIKGHVQARRDRARRSAVARAGEAQ